MKVAIAEARSGNGQEVVGFPTSAEPTANDRTTASSITLFKQPLKSDQNAKLNVGYQNIEHASMFGHEILRP